MGWEHTRRRVSRGLKERRHRLKERESSAKENRENNAAESDAINKAHTHTLACANSIPQDANHTSSARETHHHDPTRRPLTPPPPPLGHRART